MKATAQFHLRVESGNSGNIFPWGIAKTDPAMHARIDENFHQDEDTAYASFHVENMMDLAKIFAFYDGKGVRMYLSATVNTPDFKTYASLGHFTERHHASFEATKQDGMSIETIAASMQALTHQLFNLANQKK